MSRPLQVEVVQKKGSQKSKNYIKLFVDNYISNMKAFTPGTTINNSDLKENVILFENVQAIKFSDIEQDSIVLRRETKLLYHVYKLIPFGGETITINDNSSGEECSAADVWDLPAEELHGLWENLIYDSQLKEDLLRLVETASDFANRGVDLNIVGWNVLVLLHGPPGTGKTSLCRALAQKLAIRLSDRFPRARLVEINAQCLFSNWFSESGKLVAKLFERIRMILEDRRLLVCILVDEVESLTHSIGAVNVILTQLDRLKRYPNALVLTTSNVTEAIDVAFVNRADIKWLVGLPSERAAYEILRGCCKELMERGAVAPCVPLFSLRVLEAVRFVESRELHASLRLLEVARSAAAAGVKARALRRLPLLARALHDRSAPATSLPRFIDALRVALARQLKLEP